VVGDGLGVNYIWTATRWIISSSQKPDKSCFKLSRKKQGVLCGGCCLVGWLFFQSRGIYCADKKYGWE